MEISFVLDWASFALGAAATVVVGFLAVFFVAYGQYRKQKNAGGKRKF